MQRTVSDQGATIEPCKHKEDRWVDMSPALVAVSRPHIAAMDLEAQVQEWSAEQRALCFRPATATRWAIRTSTSVSGNRRC